MVTFQGWLAQVSELIAGAMGLALDDLPDQSYRDWFEDGMTPRQGAQAVVEQLEQWDGLPEGLITIPL